MTVTVSETEPNVFPPVDLIDAKASGTDIEVVLVTRVEGRPVRVRVKLNRATAISLADKLKAVMKL